MSMTADSFSEIRGIGPTVSERLAHAGIEDIEQARSDPERVLAIDGVGLRTFARICKGEPERRL